jgi:hypothetical protein
MRGGRKRSLEVNFDGDGNDGNILHNAKLALRSRMRKPWLWYGVGFTVKKPFGSIDGIFEPDPED